MCIQKATMNNMLEMIPGMNLACLPARHRCGVKHYLKTLVCCARVMHLGSTITGTLKPEMGA
ncbi:MAG: hypothetical protein ACLUJG_10905 [Lawsonibacter sp.]